MTQALNTRYDQWLDLSDPENILSLARQHRWIAPSAQITSLERPGEGNMNFLVRVKTDQNSIIIKQSRPWVERFRQIPAPVDRINTEAAFYEAIRQDRILSNRFPRLIDRWPARHILVLEDLGSGGDYTFIYTQPDEFMPTVLNELATLLSRLHHLAFRAEERQAYPHNMALRRLNHEYFYEFPFRQDNGLDLESIQPGLSALAQPFKLDKDLLSGINRLGQVYLSPGPALIHGDFIPSAWLKTPGGVAIIDPEFSFFGYPEFDLGIMVAHLHLAQVDVELIDQVLNTYEEPAGFDQSLRQAFTGIEILRRLIGIAQLPVKLSLERKSILLRHGAELIKLWYSSLTI